MPIELHPAFDRVMKRLDHLGWGTRDLARHAQVSLATINLWLRNMGDPSEEALGRIATALKMSRDQLRKDQKHD